ncbi:conserved unknown protein [Ectocarpus siliculosus]|uniref:Uncharacterized protein n=1 Tax=Ectocarpus siliculosus TaxID=2880 RepID=D7FM44_ECTSI|nr:conserved unknown protein [Ectocarpus siliculosus]|eukprot:CBJ29869.1 conserved unknown protein [Ectocarpus siliculosus]
MHVTPTYVPLPNVRFSEGARRRIGACRGNRVSAAPSESWPRSEWRRARGWRQIGGAIGTLFCLALTLGSSLYVLGAVETIITGFSTGGGHNSDSGIPQADPGRSIPKGTLAAIATVTATYVVFVLMFGTILSNEVLIAEKLVASRVAWPTHYLVSVGIVFSSLGAAMQCLVGSSRLVAAIANDHTIPLLRPFAPKPDEEPNKAVYLVWVLASLPCLAGNLDYITPVMTMFFLLMYACVNLSCFVLSILQSPGFRPKWKHYNWLTALSGFILCLAIMLVVSWRRPGLHDGFRLAILGLGVVACDTGGWHLCRREEGGDRQKAKSLQMKVAVSSIFLACALLFYIKYQNATRDWGDTLVGFRFQLARDMLLSLSYKDVHPKNWRPQLLVFCKIDAYGNPTVPGLLSLAGQMKMGRGLLMSVGLLEGDMVEDAVKGAEAQRVLGMHLTDERIEGFCKVSVCQNVTESAVTVMHHAGIGSLQPNTVLFAWPDDWSKNYEKGERFVSMLRGAVNARKAVMVLKGDKRLPTRLNPATAGQTIDIWWVAKDGGLLLLVPYLLKLHVLWKRCSLRLFSVIVDPKDNPEQVEMDVREYLDQVRIEATVKAVDMSDVKFNREVYREHQEHRQENQALNNMGVRAMTLDTVGGRHNLPEVIPGDEREELETETEASFDPQPNKNWDNGGSMGWGPESPPESGGASGGAAKGTAPVAASAGGRRQLDKQRLMTAVLLNRNIVEYSSGARLVVTNLPLVADMHASEVLQYVDAVGSSIAPLLMIRGAGVEVVTQYG